MKVPHSIEAEASVLGNVLVHPRKFVEVAPLLRADDFFHPVHRAVYEAMVELDAGAKPIDVVTIVEKMRELETFEKLTSLGGADFLTDLMGRVVTVENTGYHARIVRTRAERRRRSDAAREIVALAMDEETPDDDFQTLTDAKLLELSSLSLPEDDKPQSLKSVMTRTLHGVEFRYTNRDKPGALGIPTGYRQLDALTTGMQPGEMWVIAARPAMGKSAFAMNLIVNGAAAERTLLDAKQPFPAYVVSLEMADESLGERMIAAEGGVGLQQIRTGRIERAEWVKITGTAGELAGRAIWIDPKRSLNVAEIRSRVRRWRLDEGKSARPCRVVVDYLQLVSSLNRGGETRDRQLEIAAVSRGLKLLAGEINGVVIALAQLSRKCEERADKRPILSDLRESGAIEQDADVVAFLYRDEVYHPQTPDKGVAEVIVAKQRNGPVGVVRLGWQGHIGKFVNLKDEG